MSCGQGEYRFNRVSHRGTLAGAGCLDPPLHRPVPGAFATPSQQPRGPCAPGTLTAHCTAATCLDCDCAAGSPETVIASGLCDTRTSNTRTQHPSVVSNHSTTARCSHGSAVTSGPPVVVSGRRRGRAPHDHAGHGRARLLLLLVLGVGSHATRHAGSRRRQAHSSGAAPTQAQPASRMPAGGVGNGE